uniref:EGF-like domain-containing protein n=1 Tax=Pyrodinium bahamense TaxID=73915 RepID=A0A7S0A101_9DINO
MVIVRLRRLVQPAIVMALLFDMPATDASLLRGSLNEDIPTSPPHWRCFGGCADRFGGDSSAGCECEQGHVKILARWVQEASVATTAAFPKELAGCTCTVEGEDCHCVGDCNEDVQVDVCTELLGHCQCTHFDEGICECNGYCHTKDQRAEACFNEAGCSWTGNWCEAEVGLMWY